eukprot:jgi/Bigna1/78929/fgenesh1_pg.58_\
MCKHMDSKMIQKAHTAATNARACQRAYYAERGELCIVVPDDLLRERKLMREKEACKCVSVQVKKERSNDFDLMDTDAKVDDDVSEVKLRLVVRIDYRLKGDGRSPRTGMHSVLPRNGAYEIRPKLLNESLVQALIHLHVSGAAFLMVSVQQGVCVELCVGVGGGKMSKEHSNALSTFEMTFHCSERYSVVASGDPISVEEHTSREGGLPVKYKTFKYDTKEQLVNARGIGFAAGPFEKFTLDDIGIVDDLASVDSPVPIEIYIPWEPKHVNLGRKKKDILRTRMQTYVRYTCQHLAKILDFVSNYLRRTPFPTKTFRQVFVREAVRDVEAYTGMA